MHLLSHSPGHLPRCSQRHSRRYSPGRSPSRSARHFPRRSASHSPRRSPSRRAGRMPDRILSGRHALTTVGPSQTPSRARTDDCQGTCCARFLPGQGPGPSCPARHQPEPDRSRGLSQEPVLFRQDTAFDAIRSEGYIPRHLLGRSRPHTRRAGGIPALLSPSCRSVPFESLRAGSGRCRSSGSRSRDISLEGKTGPVPLEQGLSPLCAGAGSAATRGLPSAAAARLLTGDENRPTLDSAGDNMPRRVSILLLTILVVGVAAAQHWEFEQVDSVSAGRALRARRSGSSFHLGFIGRHGQIVLAHKDSLGQYEAVDSMLVRA
jgi:hypothetical protein